MKFKPEDFDLQIKLSMTSDILNKKAAEMANAKLQEWLDASEMVYGVEITVMGETWISWNNSLPKDKLIGPNPNKIPIATHKAKLVCIQEIK